MVQKDDTGQVNDTNAFAGIAIDTKELLGVEHMNVLDEVSLMFIGYNLGRCISVQGAERPIKALKECCLPCFSTTHRLILSHFKLLFEEFKSLQKSCYDKFNVLINSSIKAYELSLGLK